MARSTANTKAKKERGMALLLTLFALLLLSAIGLFMVLSSMTETRIDANYGTGLRAYYSARSGLEEARDRITYPSTSTTKPGGLADLLPQDIAGDTNGVLYVLTPAGGETVDPTDPTSPYFDDELCHDYNSGTPRDIKCTMVPVVPNWQLAPQFSLAPASGQMGYKWIRINIKTNRIADPYFVDQNASGMPVDTRICWDGQTEQLSPGGKNPSCDANGMQTVYMLTALAATPQARGLNGARKLLRAEIVAPSIRPAGALTATNLNLPTSGGAAGVPPLAIDGRVYDLNGKPSTSKSCSAVAPLATDSGSTQLEQALNQIRKNIVQTANASCNADGTGLGANLCPPALWWVRGTNLNTRFITTSSGTSSTSGSGHDGHGGDDDEERAPIGVSIGATCDSTSPSCYTHLDLAAPQLFGIAPATTGPNVPFVTSPQNAIAPFQGNTGNQADATIYQPSGSQTVLDQIAAVKTLVTASANQANYFTATSATLAPSYGTKDAPAIVNFTDPTLTLQSPAGLTGFGVLAVTGSLEVINGGNLNWNGIVVITSSTGHVTIGSDAKGQINGALLLQPGASFNFPNATASGASSGQLFLISYSCEAIDLPFSTLPFKIISTTESSF